MAILDLTQEEHLKDLLMPGEGEMATRTRALDWTLLPPGPVTGWPQELRVAVSLCLASRHAIEIWWGPEYLRFYNDAYRPILGDTKHPQFIGRPGQEMWAEIWHVIEPMLRSVRESGQAIYRDDLQLFMTRNGYVEETYFSFSYGPIFQGGEVAGIFCPCTETTAYVLQRRRLSLLRRIAGLDASETLERAGSQCVDLLLEGAFDVSFAALYLCDKDTNSATLVAQNGLKDPALLPEHWEQGGETSGKLGEHFAQVCQTRNPVVIDNLPRVLGGPVIGGPWSEPLKTAVMLPLRHAADASLAGILIAGVSSRLPYNDEYRVFFELMTDHISNLLTRTSSLLEERRRSELFASMFSSAPAFIAVLRGREHTFQFANPTYMQLVGDRDLLGRPLVDALPEISHQGFVDLLDGIYRSGTPYRGDAVRVELRRGARGALETRYLTFVGQPMTDTKGVVDGIFILGMDVTETVSAQEALRKSEKLSTAGRLAATVAHEVNNPLEAMTNLLYLAKEGVTPEGAVYLGIAEEELNRIAHITRQTLAFYRESSTPASFDISEAVRAILLFYQKPAQRADVDLRIDLESGCEIVGVKGEIRQVLSNLIANSLDALSGQAGAICIATRARRNTCRLTVTDTGSGVTNEALPRIWEPFFTTKASFGTGLGLWVTREIIDKHHGTVRVRTRTTGPRRGTSFIITFPAAEPK